MSKQFTFEAIGTHWWIEIFDEISDENLEAACGRLEVLSSTFNSEYSRFRDGSFVGILNRERLLENPTEECRALLVYGKQLYLRSNGSFNLLVGHILEARGYDAKYSFKADETEHASAPLTCNPLSDLIISESEITLTCGNVDLGGYGKGWLIDKLAHDLKAHDIEHFLINGGGDMYATSDKGGEAITIYLEHPTETGKYLMETSLLNQGFAASSPFKRQWKSGGKTYEHVVAADETPQVGTFVKAATAVDADAFATVAMLWPEASLPALATEESLAIARFDPLTSQFWSTANFNSV
jgi:FAD:protein FMN transferase